MLFCLILKLVHVNFTRNSKLETCNLAPSNPKLTLLTVFKQERIYLHLTAPRTQTSPKVK